MRKTRLGIGLLIVVGLSACAANSDMTNPNPNLQSWCDAHPCGWVAVPEDGVQRVGTWHPNDYAAELVSDDAELSQVEADWTNTTMHCLAFSLIAKVAADAQVFLELDFLDDGQIEFSEPIPTSDWDVRTFKITTPTWWQGVRFIIRKAGPGRVMVARLLAEQSQDCSPTPISLSNRPLGAICNENEECESQRCAQRLCVGCTADNDCDGDQLCGARTVSTKSSDAASDAGVSAATQLWTQSCMSPGSAKFGEVCSSDAQCMNGLCANGVCSECATDEDCPKQQHCGLSSDVRQSTIPSWPQQCAPAQSRALSGQPCITARDCASGLCVGGSYACGIALCSGPGLSRQACSSQCPLWQVVGGTCN